MRMRGHWLLGTKGTERIIQVTEKLQSESLKNINKKSHLAGGELFTEYKPWMDCDLRQEYFLQNPHTKSLIKPSLQIFKSDDELTFLKGAFDLSDEEPFGLVDQAKAPFRIADSSSSETLRFENEIKSALDLIYKSSSDLEKRFQKLVKEIIPLTANNSERPMREMGAGRSVHWYKGGIFVGLPKPFAFDKIELAINLVHEMGHQALMIYQNADRIIFDDLKTPVYSAIRKTARPAILSFHAMIALAYMAEFLHGLDLSKLTAVEVEFVRMRKQEIFVAQKLGLQSFSRIEFTEFGKMLFDELTEQLSLGMAA